MAGVTASLGFLGDSRSCPMIPKASYTCQAKQLLKPQSTVSQKCIHGHARLWADRPVGTCRWKEVGAWQPLGVRAQGLLIPDTLVHEGPSCVARERAPSSRSWWPSQSARRPHLLPWRQTGSVNSYSSPFAHSQQLCNKMHIRLRLGPVPGSLRA